MSSGSRDHLTAEQLQLIKDKALSDAMDTAIEATKNQLGATIPVRSGELKIEFFAALDLAAEFFKKTGRFELDLDHFGARGARHAKFQIKNLDQWGQVIHSQLNRNFKTNMRLAGLEVE